MSLTAMNISSLGSASASNFEEAKSTQSNLIWQHLEKTTVQEAVEIWLATLSPRTRINYQSELRKLAEMGLLSPFINLQAFALVNHEAVIDQIKLVPEWSNAAANQELLAISHSLAFFIDALKG